MPTYHRRLPHIWSAGQPVFLTWRLHGSLPWHRPFAAGELTSGEAFAAMDRLLDDAREGPQYFRRAEFADMVVKAIRYNAREMGQYELHAFVVMPNHVHMLVTPLVALPRLTKSLKGITGKRGNAMLGLSGVPFWQEESYDHLVRDQRELERIRRYIEINPVRAGLVGDAGDYRWSSAWGDRGVARGPGGSAPLDCSLSFRSRLSLYSS